MFGALPYSIDWHSICVRLCGDGGNQRRRHRRRRKSEAKRTNEIAYRQQQTFHFIVKSVRNVWRCYFWGLTIRCRRLVVCFTLYTYGAFGSRATKVDGRSNAKSMRANVRRRRRDRVHYIRFRWRQTKKTHRNNHSTTYLVDRVSLKYVFSNRQTGKVKRLAKRRKIWNKNKMRAENMFTNNRHPLTFSI